MRIGKAALDKVLPPVITGSVAIVIGIALAGAALNMAGGTAIKTAPEMQGKFWLVAFLTLLVTVAFSVSLQGKGLIGMLPILLGAIVGYLVAIPFGLVSFDPVVRVAWLRVPKITFPAFGDPRA